MESSFPSHHRLLVGGHSIAHSSYRAARRGGGARLDWVESRSGDSVYSLFIAQELGRPCSRLTSRCSGWRPAGLAAGAGSCGRRSLVVAVVLAGSVVFAGEHLDLSIRGVKLGTLKPVALTALGKPLRTETDHDSEMGMGDTLDLSYPGLTVELCKPEGHPPSIPAATEFHVWRIKVTDARWNVSPGLHVGMSRAALERVSANHAPRRPRTASRH